jgi:release factor glutamine methyltransferase
MNADLHHQPLSVACALDRWRQLTHVSDTPQLDSQMLLSHVLQTNRAWLYTHGTTPLTAAHRLRFEEVIARRSAGEPVAYLTGKKAFWNAELSVSPATLIPRPESELLVESILSRFTAAPGMIVDLGTGSGAIAVALAAERPGWDIFGTDICEHALAVAAENSRIWAGGRVRLLKAHWLDPFAVASIGVVVSNPPYIPETDPHLVDLHHEPRQALTAGADGLGALRQIIAAAPASLRPGGFIFLEHGFDQQEAVIRLLTTAGFVDINGQRDLNGQPRLVSARWP